MTRNRSPHEPAKHGHPVPVVVRTATPHDAEAIGRVDAARGAGELEDLVPRVRSALERISRGDLHAYTCVAIVKSEIIGYGKCAFREWSKEDGAPPVPDGWYLTGVEVRRGHRRRGIGRALTEHRIAWLRERTDVVYYFTGEGNLPSQDLHRALGFAEVARDLIIPEPPPFSNEERHVLGRKDLTG